MAGDRQHSDLFIDAGQTGVQMRSAFGAERADYSFPPVDTSRSVAPQLVSLIATLFHERGFSLERVSIASTGVSDSGQAAIDVCQGLQDAGVREVLFAHDSVAGYLAALGNRPGVVALVGTGVVTLAVGPAGSARVDGWGNILGDVGSGYWIGRMGLEHALRAHDGRGPKTVLLDMAVDEFGDVENAYLELQSDPNRVARVASLARRVIESAPADAVSLEIVHRAAKELSLSMDTALRRAGFDSDAVVEVSWTGGVVRSNFFAGLLTEEMLAVRPLATLVDPRGHPIDGVEIIPQLEDSHPLSGLIERASAS
jgi:glucosamine kinase